MDLDLVQSLHQTQIALAERDDDRLRPLAEAVEAVLSQYQVRQSGDVAYREEGATVIDRTGPDSPEQRGRARAALMAFADDPSQENADHARAALQELHGTLTG